MSLDRRYRAEILEVRPLWGLILFVPVLNRLYWVVVSGVMPGSRVCVS